MLKDNPYVHAKEADPRWLSDLVGRERPSIHEPTSPVNHWLYQLLDHIAWLEQFIDWQPIAELDLTVPANLLVGTTEKGKEHWVTRASVMPDGTLMLIGAQFAPTHFQLCPAGPAQ